LQWLLGGTIVAYVAGMFLLAHFAQRKIHNNEDFVVAGRRLPLSLAWMTLLATWFGAGTMLTAADEVRDAGLRAAALDPFGAGCCLLLAGLFVARPLWRMRLLTLPDFFRRKFGGKAEVAAALVMVPSYFGWVAAQFVALAEMLQLFFGLDPLVGVALVALVGTGYTLMGGMWSVTLTDAVQIVIVLVGLVVLACVALAHLGGGSIPYGFTRLWNELPAEKLVLVPRDSAAAFWQWTAVFATGALGNLPGQDLLQRVFASKSERVAQGACFIAGGAYLAFGLIPVGLGLAANLIAPDARESIVPVLARTFFHPAVAVVFLVTLLSAVLSTIDSAILAPSTVLAQNLLPRLISAPPLRLNRLAVLFVAACSLATAYLGEDAYSLLEGAYAVGLVGVLAPLLLGLHSTPRGAAPALASMGVGTGLWLGHYAAGYEYFLAFLPTLAAWRLPLTLSAAACGVLAYFVCEPPWRVRWRRP
jgi:Na+/proline symporter